MSLKSNAPAVEQEEYIWRVERIVEGERDRFKASSVNHPEVFAIGDSEQKAVYLAETKMREVTAVR